jgi:hypothetical protein
MIHSSPADMGALNRLLVIRSAQMSQLEKFLESLRVCRPACEVGVLTNPQFADQCRSHAFVRRVEVYRGGRFFSARGIRGKTAGAIRRHGYDAVVVLLCNPDGGGYENVFNMLRVLKIPEEYTFSSDSRFEPLVSRRVHWKKKWSDGLWLCRMACVMLRAWLVSPLERRRFLQRAAALNHFLAPLPSAAEGIPAFKGENHENSPCVVPVLER